MLQPPLFGKSMIQATDTWRLNRPNPKMKWGQVTKQDLMDAAWTFQVASCANRNIFSFDDETSDRGV